MLRAQLKTLTMGTLDLVITFFLKNRVAVFYEAHAAGNGTKANRL